MVFAVQRRGSTVGSVTVTEGARAVTFEVDCAGGAMEIVRCYGVTGNEPLLIGVLEPEDGKLRCKRTITQQSLKAHGGQIPKEYYLYGGPEDTPCTKRKDMVWTLDPDIDAALEHGTIFAEETAYGLCLRCEFSNDKPFTLCFAAPACHIEQLEGKRFAVFAWTGPFYRAQFFIEGSTAFMVLSLCICNKL